MPVRIRRHLRAAQDAEEIANYIAKDSREAALRFLKQTESTLQQLSKFPGMGSPFKSDHPELDNLRFRRVEGFPNHLIFYIERRDSIDVVRILHGAQDSDAALKKI